MAKKARLNDFGEVIPGAAKHKRTAASEVSGLTAFDVKKISPLTTPRHKALIHAVLDVIPSRPKKPAKVRSWERQVSMIHGILDLLARPETADKAERNIKGTGGFYDKLKWRVAAYEKLGVKKSLKNFDVSTVGGDITLYHGKEPVATVPDEKALHKALSEHVNKPKPVEMRLYVCQTPYEDKRYSVCAKTGNGMIPLMGCDNAVDGARIARAQRGTLRQRFEAVRNVPDERRAENEPRTGPVLRLAHVREADLMSVFGFRGGQFGNSVSNKKRQEDINNLHDAFLDLAFVLEREPRKISLGEGLGIAFGARGRGGVNPAKAHYEPDRNVINLTNESGAGSLAHEWFHAFDKKMGGADFASKRMNAKWPHFVEALKRTDIVSRSKRLDAGRNAKYWSTPEEVMARCFESWVISRLSESGRQNDYLANVKSEEEFRADDGQEQSRYPYPTEAEMPVIDAAFREMFSLSPDLERSGPES